MECCHSTYPYSLDSLSKTNTSLSEFFESVIMPLSFHGLGSVDSILNLKIHEIRQLALSINDEDVRNMYYSIKGIPILKK